MKRILSLVLVAFLCVSSLAFGQTAGAFDKVTLEMRALRATFLTGVNKDTTASMLQNVSTIRTLLEQLFKETVGKDQPQADLISGLDRDLEMLRFQLVNAAGESVGVAGSLKIALENYIKLRDYRNGKK